MMKRIISYLFLCLALIACSQSIDGVYVGADGHKLTIKDGYIEKSDGSEKVKLERAGDFYRFTFSNGMTIDVAIKDGVMSWGDVKWKKQ